MDYKNQFCVPKGLYFANHSSGCIPKATKTAIKEHIGLWQTKGVDAWDEWLDDIQFFYAQLAIMFQADSTEFCCQSTVTSALAKILGSLPKRPGRNKIVATSFDFPSLRFQMEAFTRLGYELVIIEPKDKNISMEEWDEALTDDVQLVLVTHVYSKNSYRNPVQDILLNAQAKDIYSVVDIAQSAGIIPINFKDWAATFIIGCSIKWLCGGSGAAFLWASKDYVTQFNPLDVGWFSRPDPFELTGQHEFSYALDAQRFAGGTPSVLPYLIAGKSLSVLNDLGVKNIHRHNQALLHILIDELHHDYSINSPLEKCARGGSLCLHVNDPLALFDYLAAKGVRLEFRRLLNAKSTIRISPHIYNSYDDVCELIKLLKNWSLRGKTNA